jgi:hypothetical protein
MKRVVLISIALGMFAVSAGTAAAQAPTWNSGITAGHGVGRKTLTISDQVLGPDGHTWFTITAISRTLAP